MLSCHLVFLFQGMKLIFFYNLKNISRLYYDNNGVNKCNINIEWLYYVKIMHEAAEFHVESRKIFPLRGAFHCAKYLIDWAGEFC